MKKIIYVLLFFAQPVLAQKIAGITGVVIDSATLKPVEFATVIINYPGSAKPADGTVCDAGGNFLIPKAEKGSWQLVVSFVGYNTRITIITVTDKNGRTDVGQIVLSAASKLLKEVVVEGQKELVEEKVDRTIYNAEQDGTTKGGDATDVLKRVPMLTVDVDGNVALRGSTNVKVLINNKPSTISANSVADALKQIPADQIKTVEVITSPSAKYDAEGSGGIINIVLKKNTLEGRFFNADITGGSRGSSVGLNGAYRKGKNGIALSAFYRPTYNVVSDFSNYQLTRAADTTANYQRAHNRTNGSQTTVTLVWDYDISKFSALSASVRYGQRTQNAYQDQLSTQTFSDELLTDSKLQNVKTISNNNTIDASLTFIKKFQKKDRELNVLGIFSRNNQTGGYTINSLSETDQSILQRFHNNNPGFTQESILQIDYQEPVRENQLLEIGGKSTLRKVSTEYSYYTAAGADGAYSSDTSHTSTGFNYNQTISAAYAAYTLNLGTYTIKGGGRYEYTSILSHFTGEPDINIPSYGVAVPSFNVAKKLKNGNMIKISYNKRIQRPNLRDLNPNLQASNFKNATQGNPNLKPEYTHLAEIAYKTHIKDASLNMSAFMRYNTNDIQPARIIRHDTIISMSQNIGTEANYGLTIFLSVPISDKFSLNGGTDMFYRILKNNSPDTLLRASKRGFTPNFRLFGTYTISSQWSLQFFGTYQGRNYNLQGYRTNPINHSLSVRKELFKKQGSLSLGVDNFLTPSWHVYSDLSTPYLVQSTNTTLHNTIVKLSFSYKTGKIFEAKHKQLSDEE